MPDFFVSAATGALSPVLHKLAGLLSDEYKRFKGVRGEVKFLIRELEAMHAFLLKKSEEENSDVQDKVWMKEVREISYDIEDSLDDFMVRVDDMSNKPDGFIDKCKNLLAKAKSRHRIAKAIQDLKAQVKEVSERNARYRNIGETVMNTSNKAVDPRALAIFEDASRLVGIGKPKQEVISFLTKEDRGISSQQPKIVSIVGVGGIGKTTLAKQVYEELKGQFQCHSFFSVSRNPDMFKILRTILSEVKGQSYRDTEAGSIQQLIMKINEFLQTKRFLIVVDDVWNEETWDPIKCALSNKSCGSVIITTTRIHKVAEACCSSYSDGWVYKTNPLEEHDSKSLFQNRIFEPGNECPENLKEVSDKILKKCGGLPLAIITISGLLANKARYGVHSVTEWDQIQTSIGHGLERDATMEGMMEILSLSYFDLPYHLKTCLLYLSIFPEDYEIRKETVVGLWVAEGFIRAESGEKSFNELINRNLILPWAVIGWAGNVESCRVHDIILDFIMCKSMEDNFVTVVVDGRLPTLTPPPPGTKVRRLSIQGETKGDDAALYSNQSYSNVRSILSFGSPCPCSLLGFRFMRVLDLENCRRVENRHLAHICQLFQLRYLNLRRTWITELPEQIGELQYLETLDLLQFKIPKIPTSIVRLKRLVNLLIGPVGLSCLPGGIKNLQALEKLTLFVILDEKTTPNCIEEIGELNKMRDLHIIFTMNRDSDEASCFEFTKKMVSSIQRLNKLQDLNVQCIDSSEYDIMLEVPWCSTSLRKLDFTVNPIRRVPSWTKSLVNIEELRLRIRKLDQESLYVLGSLPALISMQLQIYAKVEDIPSADKQRLMVSRRCGYRSLRCFEIWAMSKPDSYQPMSVTNGRCQPMLMFEAGSMSKLEYLCIQFDADTTISVTNGCLDFGLKHLSQLTKLQCEIFGSKLNILRVEAAIEKELGNHPNHPDFRKKLSPSTKGESSNPERSMLAVHTAQPKPHSIADDVVISSSDASGPTGGFLEPPLISAKQQALVLPEFTFNAESSDVVAEQQAPDAQSPALSSWDLNAFGSLSLCNDDPGPSFTAMQGASYTDAGGPTCGFLEAPLISAQQQALALPDSMFNAGPSDAVDEQQAPDEQSPALSSRDLNAFSSLSLRNDDLGPSFTAMEGASSNTGPTTSHGLAPGLIPAPQQTTTACFTFDAGSSNNPGKQAPASYEPSLRVKPSHLEVAATVVETTFDAGSSYQEGSRLEE